MPDALTPLRQVYGLEPDARAETPEHSALQSLREVLDARPPLSPPADVLASVLARAAEPRDALTFESEPQAAALAPMLEALDRAPRPSPPASVLARVEARAAQALPSLAAVRQVYADGPAVPAGDAVEAAVLTQSRHAVEQSLAARPLAQPSPEGVEAVLARAAEAPLRDEVSAESAVESAVLAQSLRALDRLPRPSPSAESLAAVLAAAASRPARERAAAPAPSRHPARDRAPARSRRRSVGVWAGASVLALAVALAVMLLPSSTPEAEVAGPVALADQAAPAPVQADAAPPAMAAEPPAAFQTAPSGSSLAASAAIAGLVPVAERLATPPASRPAAPPPASSPASVSPSAAPVAAAQAPPSWEASDDVRALSLRLQELEDDALGWDEPAEAFGAPASALTSTPGVQAVGGIRARARMIDSNDQR